MTGDRETVSPFDRLDSHEGTVFEKGQVERRREAGPMAPSEGNDEDRMERTGSPAGTAMCLAGAAALATVVLSTQSSFAQSLPSRTIIEGSGNIGQGKSRSEIEKKPSREDEPLTLGDWLFYPALTVGAVYNDNLYLSQFNKKAATGLQIQPSFVLRRNTGIHDTTVYGTANAQFYSSGNANQITGLAGITHVWEIRRDLLFRLQGEYGRFLSATEFDTLLGSRRPVYYDQGYLSASLTKSFDRIFVAGGGSITNAQYETNRLGYRGADGTTYQVLTRLGYQFSPLLYAYVEPSYNWVRSASGVGDSSGYSVVGGLGSDRIGLYRFNVYAGYNAQSYNNGALSALTGTVAGPVVGASASWEALRTLTFVASVNHSVGPAGTQLVGPDYRLLVTRTTGSLGANYQFSRQVSAHAGLTYEHEDYSGISRIDKVFTGSASLNYMFTRFLGLSANYSYSKVDSTWPGASYSQNVMSLGARAQF